MTVDMQTFLDSAVKDAVGVSVRCGEAKNPRTIAKIFVGDCNLALDKYPNFDPIQVDTWEEAFDTITEVLEGVGWGIEPGEECARLHLLGENGNQIRTWSRTKWSDALPESDTATMLAGELIRMASEMRRMSSSTIASQAETIQALSETNLTLRAESLDSYRAEVEAQAEAALAATLAEIEQGVEHPDDPLRDTAAGIIQGIASQFLPGAAGPPLDAKSLILQTLRADPDVVRELAQDPEMVEMFMQADNGIPDAPGDIPSDTPNPMDE